MGYILGIESTCDDSGLGVVNSQTGKVIYNKVVPQTTLHSRFGGVVPEIASRGHLKNLPPLIDEFIASQKSTSPKTISQETTSPKTTKQEITVQEIDLLSVSCKPGLIGSLLIGTSFTNALAWAWDKKIVGVDHLVAHLLSPLINNRELSFPYLCFLISGGHSMAVLVKEIGNYQLLGKTQDDALGEAFDKTAKILGLCYPGGPLIEKIASLWEGELLQLPIPLKKHAGYNFSYSGLKTATKNLAIKMDILAEKEVLLNHSGFLKLPKKKQQKIAQLAASFQYAAYNSLLWNFKKILKKYPLKNFAIAGGVARNSFIRKNFQQFCKEKKIAFFYPQAEYCTDNGAMIAFCAFLYQQKNFLEKLNPPTAISRSSF